MNVKKMFLYCLLATSLTACNQSEEMEEIQGANEVTFRITASEMSRAAKEQFKDGDAIGIYAVERTGDGVAAQLGAGTFQQVGDADAEGQRALVQEREGQVGLSALKGLVFSQCRVGFLGHFRHGEAADVAHFADTESDFGQLIIDAIGIHLVTSGSKSCESEKTVG